MVALDTCEDLVSASVESTEEQCCHLFENPAANVAHLSADGAFLAVSHEFSRIVGYPREELGTSLENLFHTVNSGREICN
jgi:hypothetical protein